MKLFESLQKTGTEREVEQLYNEQLKKYLRNSDISHPYECDGLIEVDTKTGSHAKLLIEYKYDEDFQSAAGRAKVLIQTVYYLKRFEKAGEILPNIVFIADKNECFVLHTNDLHHYLNEDVDWSIAPSQAFMKNPKMMLEIAADPKLQTWVYTPERDDFREVVKKIGELANNVTRKVHLCEENIEKVFDYFEQNVWKDKTTSSHTLVSYFIGLLTNTDYYVHPNNKNILCVPNRQIQINGKACETLFNHFDKDGMSPADKRHIVSIADRLIEDSQRRRSGDFWTPKVWVDESHRRIEKVLGEDWKEKYVVWDNCCGGKNLTRDYKFKELYSSTLFQSELNMSADYNPEGTAFQFDFLNDSLDKLPDGLKTALEEDKPFVFFLNPPYSVAGSGANTSKVLVKAGSSKTKISEQMNKEKMGKGSNDLMKQFLYRICKIKEQYNLSNCHICLFSGTGFMRKSSSKPIRELLNQNFKHEGGYLINAGEFANVSSSWGISFTQFGPGEHTSDEYKLDVLSQENFEVTKIGEKILYNLDHSKRLVDWCDNGKRRDGKMKETLTNRIGLEVFEPITVPDDCIGVQIMGQNLFSPTDRKRLLFCTPYQTGFNKFYINPDNFEKVMTIHGVRQYSLSDDWTSFDDEFSVPNESDPRLTQFMRDSLIYSLFDGDNYCTSTDHNFNNRHWDINNEFFWMSRDGMIALADEHHNDSVYKDAIKDSDRYVYKYIQDHWDEFSDDAKRVYRSACDLVIKTFPYRDLFNSDHPEVQVNHWDAGWVQIKKILKEYFPDDLKAFRKEFKAFEERMRLLVYELGFLRCTYVKSEDL